MATLPLFQLVYRQRTPPPTRHRPLQVICLGLPRSGTESLSRALSHLGYASISHGFDWWINRASDSALYYELAVRRAKDALPSDPAALRRQYLDRLTGDFDATTDVPTAWFAGELVRAYPDAKVVLNRRRDVQAWKRSFRKTVLPIVEDRVYWWLSWFHAELFWALGLTLRCHGKELFQGNFERNAEDAYVGHYEKLEGLLRDQGREWLDWGVEDGWEPLCKFLDKPFPSTEFPSGNLAAEFMPKLMSVDAERLRVAKSRACVALSGLVGALGIAVWYLSPSIAGYVVEMASG